MIIYLGCNGFQESKDIVSSGFFDGTTGGTLGSFTTLSTETGDSDPEVGFFGVRTEFENPGGGTGLLDGGGGGGKFFFLSKMGVPDGDGICDDGVGLITLGLGDKVWIDL